MQYPESLPEALKTIDNMQARIDALKAASRQDGASVGNLQHALGFSPQQAKIVALLSDGGPKRYEQLYQVVNTGDIDWCPSPKFVPVVMVAIRKKLWPLGFRVETLRSYGFRMFGPLDGLRKVMAGGEVNKHLPRIRGGYPARYVGREIVFERTVKGRLLLALTERYPVGEPFPFERMLLADEFGVTPQAVYFSIRRLEEDGYVTRTAKGAGCQPPIYKINKTLEKTA